MRYSDPNAAGPKTVPRWAPFRGRLNRAEPALSKACGRHAVTRESDAVRRLTFEAAVGRYGGDEFVVVVSDEGEHALRTVADAIRQTLATPMVVQGVRIPGGAAMGWARGDRSSAGEHLMSLADEDTYRDKARQRSAGAQPD